MLASSPAMNVHRMRFAALFGPTVWLCCAACAVAPSAASEGSGASRSVDFNRHIRPILSEHCYACHGPDKESREADLRLDREESAKGDRGGYHVVVAGRPGDSAIMDRITAKDEMRMPPADFGERLSARQIDLLQRWIAQGAHWARHWAYVPPRHHPTPPVHAINWPANWIDRFILSELESRGLTPSPEADRVTLVRRLFFDLTGLPPTPEDVHRIQGTPGQPIYAASYERLVDALLRSPHFGERMAMYWLDLVRYADTVGYHGDQDHASSPYRDYVIHAINENVPFDRFTREQLAGDLLPDSGIDQKIASAYNRILQTSHEGGVQPREYLAIYGADRVRNLSAVWLGATMGCAQCHDHKYDPYTMRDFYSMKAFFADIDEARHFTEAKNELPTARPPEIKVLTGPQRKEVARLEAEIDRHRSRLEAAETQDDVDVASLEAEIEHLRAQAEAIRATARRVMITQSIEPRTIRILPRGNWLDDSGAVVEPAVPEFLGQLPYEATRATRLDLARWLTDPDRGVGGLTARVFANRFWYLFFGSGLSKVLDDLGAQGEPASHPELLDRLALEFIASGWDVKHMVKQLVMSRTYRQSSRAEEHLRKLDPENRLLARQSRYRLPAEMVRDNALAVSGLLVRHTGGLPIRPYQPAGYYRHLNFPKRVYEPDTDQRLWRRSVYMHWQRQFLHPMLKAFDAPRREACTAARPRSNTPTAALVMLNDPQFVEAARVFASRIARQGGGSVDARIDFAFQHALSRSPDDRERKLIARLYHESREQYRRAPERAEELVTIGAAPVPEGMDAVEMAAWTCVTRAMFNLNELITRN